MKNGSGLIRYHSDADSAAGYRRCGASLRFEEFGDYFFQRDVFVIDTNGTQDVAVAAGPRDETVAGWSRDGGDLLIVSEGGGTRQLLTQPVSRGRPAGRTGSPAT